MGMKICELLETKIKIVVIAKHQSIILNKIIEKDSTKKKKKLMKKGTFEKEETLSKLKKQEEENEIMELSYMGKISILSKKLKKKELVTSAS